MKVKILFPILSLMIVMGFLGCDDDEKFAPLEGTWQGTQAEGTVLLFGVPTGFEEEDDTFNPVLEFKESGTVTLTQDGVPTQGTWSQAGDQLTTSLTLNTDFVDLPGTFTIKILTATRLQVYFEKDGVWNDPDTGIDVEGTLKATLHFDRK